MSLALPPQRLRPDTWLEHQDPASHTAQKKRKKENKTKQNETRKLTDRTLGQIVKANLYRQTHTKKYTHTHSQKEKKEKKIFFYIYIKKGRE